MPKKKRKPDKKGKCPACGSELDAGAYRCPKCFVYFCHRCHVRIPENEKQYQCANSSCKGYGKLFCYACAALTKEWYEVGRYRIRPEDRTVYIRAIRIALIGCVTVGIIYGTHYGSFWMLATGFGCTVPCLIPLVDPFAKSYLEKLRRRTWRKKGKAHRKIKIFENGYCPQCKKSLKRLN